VQLKEELGSKIELVKELEQQKIDSKEDLLKKEAQL